MATENKHKKNLPKFLDAHKVKESSEATHGIIGDTKYGVYGGKYKITDDDANEFLDLYYRYVFKDGKNAYITEKHRENGPIVIDLDFRMNGNMERTYTDETIMTFLDIVNKELYNLINPAKALCQAFVMEKSGSRYLEEKNITKDGIHIMYPYIVVDPKIQFALRYNVIMNPSCAKIFKDIGIVNPIDDIYDKCVIDTNNWLMYGSSKPGGEPYQLTKRYSYDMEEITKKITQKEKIRSLSVRYFDTKYVYNLSEEEKSKIEEINSKLPEKQKAKSKMKLKRVKSPMNKIRASDEDYNMARELVPILSDHRADDYEAWIQLGFCLHNIDYRLLEDWDNFSKRSFKYEEGGCKTQWVSMSNEGLSLGSLCRWAKQDNIVEFTKISSKNRKQLLIASLSMTHTDIGRVIYHEFKNEFVCAALRKQEWYQFKNHRWRKTDSAVALRKYISNAVVDLYMKFQAECNNEAVELDSSSTMKEILIERSNKIGKLIAQLKKTSFKKSLIDECAEMFYVEKFEEELDSNLDLICFENGVYDLDRGEFREGFPEDKLSFTTGIYYRDFDDDEEELIQVKTFMEQVLPIKPVRDYMYRLLSSFVSGRVKEQKFHIWTGCGGNGKSKLIELFRMGFGEYCCTLPVSLITQKRGRAEGATPALAMTKGKRFACFQEPEGDESINVGLMKELSGGDTLIARGLHKDPIEFKPQFKMVLTCNVLPDINASDRGTWRRVRAVEFKSVFTDQPDPNDEFQFQIDEQLDDKMDTWKEPFMFLLFKEHEKYKQHGILEPEDVMKFTKQYQNDSDNFTQFFDECIAEANEYSDSSGECVSLNEMYQLYTEWFAQNKGTQTSPPKRKDLNTHAIKKYGAATNKKWYGIKLKDINDNTEDTITDI